jgi:hypothetical protein
VEVISVHFRWHYENGGTIIWVQGQPMGKSLNHVSFLHGLRRLGLMVLLVDLKQ